MAEKDYADIMFDAVSVLIDKKIEAVKFDQTINATIVDATRAAEGVYVVSTGNAKFTAYSTEVEYKDNDAVLVMIPQGNYDNQKMIIGKQVDDTNTPLVYKSPFQGLVNITNNLIQGKKEIGYWANDPIAESGLSWNIDNNDFRTSTIFLAADRLLTQIAAASTMAIREELINQYNNLVLYDSNFDDTFIPQAEYTRLGLSAQFSTWLADYGTYTGNYGLAIEITFKSLETNTNNSFTKIITFDSKEFFGDVYNFETYYTQENVYDISDYTDYPITRLRLFAYQRENFIGANGERVPYNDATGFGNVNPNIFIKDPYLCLGIPVEDFNEDMATIMTTSTVTYYKGDLSPDSDYTQRFSDNEKIIGLRWVHKDTENDIIKAVEPDEFPDTYEVRWYRYKLGAQSPDIYAGAHWERLYYPRTGGMDNEGDYYVTDPNVATPELDTFTNELEIRFWPNVNNASEKIKVVIVKNEGTENDPLYRRVAVSNILEFTNETDVRNKASVIDMNALSIQFVDESGEMSDCLGTYFIYDRADKILNDQDKEIRFLQLAFDPNEPNVYQKAELTDWTSIKWYVPCGSDTMIVPATPASAAAQPVSNPTEENNFIITNQTKIAFFIKPVLNRYAGHNTVRAEVIKDGQSYTAEAQMVFGTSGTSGSDYTIQLIWHHGKNAVDVSSNVLNTEPSEHLDGSSLGDRKVLEGELVLYDQNGQNVTQSDFDWDIDWKVAERTDSNANEILQPAYQETDYYYPIYLAEDEYENGELTESNFVTFKQGQLDDGKDSQRQGHYYYYTLKDIFNNAGLVLGEDGIIFSGVTNGNKISIFEKVSKIYYWDNEKNHFANCVEIYNKGVATNQQLTAETIANSTAQGTGIPDKFLDAFSYEYTIDEEEYIQYQQFYYKTHETEQNKKKKQLIFEQLENVYGGDENNTILNLSSQAADDVFFKTNITAITKQEFFNAIQQNILQYQTGENFITILEYFAEQYYNKADEQIYTLNPSTYNWQIKVGNNTNSKTLRNELFSIHSNGQFLRIELISKLLDFSNGPGLYYNNNQFYITDSYLSNVNILRELYSLLFDNDAITNERLEELQIQYFYMIIENADILQELLVLPENSTDRYVYENNGEVVFISPGTRLSCGVLRYLFNSEEIKFYKIISNSASNTNQLKDILKQNFNYTSDSWEAILSRIIDYNEKSKNEIQNTNLSASYLMSYSNLDLKTTILNSLENGESLSQILSNLNLDEQSFQELIHNQSGLNNCLISILSLSETSESNENLRTPGFVQTSDYYTILSKEKQKWYLEQNFRNISDEEVGGIFVLDAIRQGQMRNFTDLMNFTLTANQGEKLILGPNPDSSSWYDYVNILFSLKFLLGQKQAELLSDIQSKNTNGTISGNNDNAVEYHIMHISSSSDYTNADYIYGKDLFRYIKTYFNSAVGNKYVLEEVNNLGLLFKLMFKENFYINLNSQRFGPLDNSMGFFTNASSSIMRGYAVARNTFDTTRQNDLSYLGTFTTNESYYIPEFKDGVDDDNDGIIYISGVPVLQACATAAGKTYSGYSGDEEPIITISLNNNNIIYSGTRTIVTNDSTTYTPDNDIFRIRFREYMFDCRADYFKTSNALSFINGKDIFDFYDFAGNDTITQQVWTGGYNEYTGQPVYQTVTTYLCPLQYIAMGIGAGDNLVPTQLPITASTNDTLRKADITWSRGMNNLKYKYLCANFYFTTNGFYPDFTSLLMAIIISSWSANSNNVLKNLFGDTYVKNATGSEDVFGQSNILIFFPYSNETTYFASINKILQRNCIVNGYIQDSNIYTEVIQKLQSNPTITQLTSDSENLFYVKLMSMLFNSGYDNVDYYYSSQEEQQQLTLDILLSKEEIFWQCYDCVFNVDYPENDSNGSYRSQQNTELNLFDEFSIAANTNYLEVKDISPDDRKKDQLKTKMFSLLRSYYQKKNFYQFQLIENTNRESLYNYVANLCFKSPLDEDIYTRAYCNISSNANSSHDNTTILLQNLYLNGTGSFNNIPTLTATSWTKTIIQSMNSYPAYEYDLSVGSDYNYYVDTNGKLEKISDILVNNSYPLQELYTYIYYSNFYTYNKANNNIVSKDIIAKSIIDNNQNVVIINNQTLSEAIPSTEIELLQSMIQALVSDKQSDVDLYKVIVETLGAQRLDNFKKQWYYKINNKMTKELIEGLFTNTDINVFLKEIIDIKNSGNDAKFYQTNSNDSGEIYFNYYNPWSKKAFVKKGGFYILDPNDDFSLYETYYYPLQSEKMVNKIALLEYEYHGGNTFIVRPKADSSTDVLLKSLNILQVVLKNFGDYNLTSYFPIPLKNGTQGTNDQITYQVRYIEGADRVWYPITGEPEYYQNPYRLFAQKYENNILTNFEEPKESLIWEPIYYKKDNEIDNFTPSIENNILKPIVVYVKQAKNYGVICKKGNVILWSQPILVYQDRYPSTTVNKWNGTDIVLDDEAGMVLASAFAAGKKEDDNSFSGVLLGDFSRDVSDPSLSAQTGIYGFHHGRPSYAFLEDGKGYIGKEGKGRIWFDGEDSQIYSWNWKGNDNLGMLLDIDDGFIEMHQNISGYQYYIYSSHEISEDITGKKEITPTTDTVSGKSNITIDSGNQHYPLQIGLGNSPSFKVGWAGDVHIERGSLKGAYIEGSLIKGSDIFANYIQSDRGWLGGWVVNSNRLSSPPVETAIGIQSWTELSPLTGIKTNRIQIETISSIDESRVAGVLGYLKGHDGVTDTNAIGISSNEKIILQSTGANIAIKSLGIDKLYLESPNGVKMYCTNQPDSNRVAITPEDIVLHHSSDIKIEGAKLTVTVDKNNQHGIYARFG